MCGCCIISIAATSHPHTQLHRRLVDSRSIRADSSSTSGCCSRSHGSVGVKTERQEECAFSISENHLSWCGVGFDHDAGTFVPCSDRVDPRGSQESESVTLAMDASLTGWGAVMSGHPARGLWSGRHLTWHINWLEILAVFQALKHFLPDLRDRNVPSGTL